jgi:hypothetical protein
VIDLGEIWAKVRVNREAARALATLERDGFPLKDIGVGPETWSGLIARFPSLPKGSSSSRSIEVPRSFDGVIQFLLRVAQGLESEYTVIEARDEKGVIYTKVGIPASYPNFRKLAEDLEKISRSTWALTRHNAQKNVIASLRWEITHRTGKPHDTELFYLLRAACQAAGKRTPLSSILLVAKDAIRKSLDHDRATRKAGRRKLLKPHK